MIYTCTVNPSLDYYLSVNDLIKNTNNRSDNELFEAGGKGVNISIFLNNFMIPSSTLGFLGGFLKDYYLKFLSRFAYIKPLFTSIEDNTRINVKVMSSLEQTNINALGPNVSEEEFKRFNNRLNNIYDDDIVIIAGNIQDALKAKMVEVIKELTNNNIKVILDTDEDVLNMCKDLNLYMVKLNKQILNASNKTIMELSNDLLNRNTKIIMYSGINEPSLLLTSKEKYEVDCLNNSLIKSTGTGESMIAGYLYGLLRGGNIKECFKYACSSSISTALANDLEGKNKIEDNYNKIEVKDYE